MTYSIAIFIPLAIITIGAAIAVVTLRNVFHAALMLVVAFFGVAGFYVLLEAGFFAVHGVNGAGRMFSSSFTMMERRWSFARDRRDITVPMGMPSDSAISRYDSSLR